VHVNCLSVPVVYCCTGYLSIVAPVTCTQPLFAVFAGLLHLQALQSSTFFYFITLFTPLSPIISDLLLVFFFSYEEINIRLGHLLSPMHYRFPYRFNMLFSILSRILCYSRLFLITSFLTLNILHVLTDPHKTFISVLNCFFL